MKSTTGDEGTEITLTANTFTKTGYTFSEWTTKADGSGEKYPDKAKIKLTANITLYAQWTANNYTVTFNKNADDATGTMESQTFTYGTPQALNENKFSRIGYDFAGWATSADGEVTYNDKQAYSIGAENVTLYAQWVEKDKVAKVTFSYTGGEIDSGDTVTLSCATEGATIYYVLVSGTQIPDLSKKEEYKAPITITDDITIAAIAVKEGMNQSDLATATFTVKTYTVTFSTAYGTAPEKITGLKKGSKLTSEQLPTLTATDYKFYGWYNGETQFTTESEITADITLTAKWEAINYTIKYELDGGTNSDGNPENYTIETETITLEAPTKDGYTFVCWYSDRSKKTEIAKGSTGDIVLQAVWKDNANFVKVPAVSINGSETWTPASEVFVSGRTLDIKAFWMSDHEVTRAEWKAVMETTPSAMATANGTADNNPVNCVSWYDAIVYCNKRSINENLTPCYTINGSTDPNDWGDVPTLPSNDTWKDSVTCDFTANGYRLPTEAEWEWAARGGENYKYAGSDDIADVAWYTGNTNDTGTRDVKTKKANGYGLYDMTGNVQEWCWDWYKYEVITPTRCERGGNCYKSANFCEVACRFLCDPPAFSARSTGFRVVRTAQ